MKFDEICSHLSKMERDFSMVPEDYVVGFGAACVFHGIRHETADLDIDLDAQLFDRLAQQHQARVQPGHISPSWLFSDVISFHRGLPPVGVKMYDDVQLYTTGLLIYRYRKLSTKPDRLSHKCRRDECTLTALLYRRSTGDFS